MKVANALDSAIFETQNELRTDPQSFISYLESELESFQGNNIVFGDEPIIQTKEGPSAWREAINALKQQPSLPEYKWKDGLGLACQEHVIDIGNTGEVGHMGALGNSLKNRIYRKGKTDDMAPFGGSIAYGLKSATAIVMQLFVDDGVPNRENRANLMSTEFKFTGVACGRHKVHKDMCCLNYSKFFIDNPQNSTQRNQAITSGGSYCKKGCALTESQVIYEKGLGSCSMCLETVTMPWECKKCNYWLCNQCYIKPKAGQTPGSSSNGPSSSGVDKITVYGKADCGWCTKIKGDFNAAGIDYTFVSSERDPGRTAMMNFLRKNGHQGSIPLPVVDVFGTMKFRASVEDVRSIKPNAVKPKPAQTQAPSSQPRSQVSQQPSTAQPTVMNQVKNTSVTFTPSNRKITTQSTIGNKTLIVTAKEPANGRSVADFLHEDVTIPGAPTSGFSSCTQKTTCSANAKMCRRTTTDTYTMKNGETKDFVYINEMLR